MPTELLVLVSKHSLFDVFVPEKELGAFSLLCRDHTNREQMERPVLRVSFRRILQHTGFGSQNATTCNKCDLVCQLKRA